MTEFLVIRLPAADTQPFSWIVADGDGQSLAMPESGSVADAARRARQRPVFALVPGEDVLMTSAMLPVRGQARMQQAAPYALEEQLAQNVSDLHFAVGTRGADGTVPVAAVARDRITSWLEQLRTAGLRPATMVADTCGVPRHAGFSVVIDQDRTLVRDPHGRLIVGTTEDAVGLVSALGAMPGEATTDSHIYVSDDDGARFGHILGDLRLLLPDVELHTLRHGALPALAANAIDADNQTPNLLQGEFGETGGLQQYWHAWRTAAVLAGAFVLVALGLKAGEVLALKAQTADLRGQINAAAVEALPANSTIVDPIVQMERRAAQLRGGSRVGDAFFLEMLQSLAAAFGDNAELSIGKLDYRNGAMDLTLTAPNVDTLDQIRRRVEADGLQAELQSADKIDIGVRGRLRITPGQLMKDWFESLEPRERVTLIVGAVTLTLALLWILLVDPLYSSASQQQDRLSQLRIDLVRANQLKAEIAALASVPGGGPAQGQQRSMIIVVESSARNSGLQVDGSRPTDDDTVRVRFESASFDALVRWMALLSSRYGVQVDVASIDRNDTPGTVDAQITVKRPAA